MCCYVLCVWVCVIVRYLVALLCTLLTLLTNVGLQWMMSDAVILVIQSCPEGFGLFGGALRVARSYLLNLLIRDADLVWRT